MNENLVELYGAFYITPKIPISNNKYTIEILVALQYYPSRVEYR